MAERNYYILLEVKSNATFDEIKISYRALAKKYHPDKNIGNKAAEEYFKEIQQAYTVLSNPEKRKKYDLKFSYYNKTQAQKREYATGPQYTSGSAYQYTKQKTQTKKNPEKKDNTESWQILVSVGIALVLLYFIISYSAEKNTASSTTVPQPTEKVNDKKIEPSEPAISNFDSPYSTYFGAEISDPESKNSITIFTTGNTEAVVCLVEKDAPNRTIRNQYMVSQTEFKMNEIPDGDYFLRIYYGTDWNPKKTFLNNSIKGGFNTEKGFVEINTGKDALKMKKMKNGSIDSYSTYEIKIDPVSNQNIKSISPAEFFQK